MIHRIAGSPDITLRIPCTPPLILERHRALLEIASVPPLPAPVLFVHTGGKPFSYQFSTSDAKRESLPGFVTLLPRAVSARFALRGVGEGTLLYIENDRHVPSWLSRPELGEPITFVDNLIVSLVYQLLATAGGKPPDQLYQTILGTALLAELRHAIAQPVRPESPRGSRRGLLLADTAVQHIHRHLGTALTVPALAGKCGLGVTQFSNTFRQVTGVTPHRYVRNARIERASELLRTTSLTIREVAEAVGFSRQSHFCTAFTQDRGISPSAYRRSCRGIRPSR